MLFVLIALWAISLIILLSDPRSQSNRRLSAVTFSGGAGAMAAVLDLYWIPAGLEAGMSVTIHELLYRLQSLFSILSYYGLPYFFLLFAISYRPHRILGLSDRLLSLLLLVPIVLCLLFTPWYTEVYPISFKIVVWWAVPYILYGALAIIGKQRLHASFSRTHWIVCSAVLPPVLFCMIMNYVLPSFGMLRMWVYNTWIVGLGAAVFVIGLFSYGFMGARIFIDRRRYDSTLRAITSGTAMLNHAIKNDAGKIKLFSMKMKDYAIAAEQPELLADIETVIAASQHMQDMIQRVHRRTEDLILHTKPCDLAELVRQSLKKHELALGAIRSDCSLVEGWTCTVDQVHVTEALDNLIANAIEAMKGQGELFVTLREGKRELVIEVRDNGPGLNKNEQKSIFEPFYSTKGGGMNFGLGLSYAYHVMRKHKGSLQLRTKKGEGASFYMIFPKRAVKATHTNIIIQQGREGYG